MSTKATIHNSRDKCGYKWAAPFVQSNYKVTSIPQVCVEPKGHEDDHRSFTNVTALNKKES